MRSSTIQAGLAQRARIALPDFYPPQPGPSSPISGKAGQTSDSGTPRHDKRVINLKTKITRAAILRIVA
jgi:hypothetical protein